jgi:hypothetical protein
MVLGGVKTGVELVVDTIRVVVHYPKFLIPIGVVWGVIAVVTTWQRFFFVARGRGTLELLAIGFAIIFLFAILLVGSCSILLEMIEHVEREGQRPSLRRATRATLGTNLGGLLGVAFLWAVVWFLLTMLQALFEDDNRDTEYSAESAVRTLAGTEGSLLSLSIDALKKGIRMLVFLILPAIVWEDRGFRDGVSRGLDVFRENVVVFATGFSLTYLVAALVFLPVGITFGLADEGLIQLSAGQWYLVMAYLGIAWSFSVYLEQLFTADLFLWHVEWEQAVTAAEASGDPVPEIRDVPRPSLLDDVASLSERKLPDGDSGTFSREA